LIGLCPWKLCRMFDWKGLMFIGSISNVCLGQIVRTINSSYNIFSRCIHFTIYWLWAWLDPIKHCIHLLRALTPPNQIFDILSKSIDPFQSNMLSTFLWASTLSNQTFYLHFYKHWSFPVDGRFLQADFERGLGGERQWSKFFLHVRYIVGGQSMLPLRGIHGPGMSISAVW